MADLILHALTKHYDETEAVRDVSLSVSSGEFFSILGPSGCGKTTLLRLIAGFEKPSDGTIYLDNRDLTGVPPQSRPIGMVFQNYALFPHMTAAENVAFGLETGRLSREEIRLRVEAILATVDLPGKYRSPVAELSGGEQQRVALARALVVEPAVLLFDEPLSNLDVALRARTREEIRTLQRKTGITTLYVTHDQSEAMSLSDRIAVMRDGHIEQIGRPVEVYDTPVTPFVAEFLGGSNLVPVTIEQATGRILIQHRMIAFEGKLPRTQDGEALLAIKPEALLIHADLPSGCCHAMVDQLEYHGFITHVVLDADGVRLRASSVSSERTRRLAPGMRVGFTLDISRCHLFPPQRV